MPANVIFDGSLFSECELMGNNRSGMLRLTEDITGHLISDRTVDVSFANVQFNQKYDGALRTFVSNNYPAQRNKIVPQRPIIRTDGGGLKNGIKRLLTQAPFRSYMQQVESADIFHSFYYPFPERIANSKVKKCITFLDIIPLRMSGYPESSIAITKSIVECIVPNFAISISEFSRQDLIDYNKKISPDRVFTAPLAASKELFYQNRNQEEWEQVRKKYKLPENYFLSVSSIDHRKNLPHLIKSFSKFVLQEKPNDLSLVLSGNFNYSNSILDDLNIDKRVRERIFITERFIENDDLAAIYSHAMCFFFMSLYEGFGLPVLEAMQCGTPVITSNTSSIPEVVGDAAIMLPPNDEVLLCDAMNNIYQDDLLREKYSKLGIERSKQFSWEKCASEYAQIFNTIKSNF